MSIIKTATTFIAEKGTTLAVTGAVATGAVAGGTGYVTLDNQIEDNQKDITMVAEKTDNRNEKGTGEYEELYVIIADQNQKIADLQADVTKLKENQGKSEEAQSKTETTTPTKTETTTTKPVVTTGEIDELIALKNAKVAKGQAKNISAPANINRSKGLSVVINGNTYLICWEIGNNKAACKTKTGSAITVNDLGLLPIISFAEAKKLLS